MIQVSKKMKEAFQNLRLYQRILLIFILCVLVPMTIMLSLSFTHLEKELKEQSFQRLRFQSKTIGMSIIERLMQLENEMNYFINNNLRVLRNKGELNDSWFQEGHFDGLTYIGQNGTVRVLRDNHTHSIIQANTLKLWPSKKPLIIQHESPNKTPKLLIAIYLSDSEWLLGQVNTTFLFNEDANFNLPPDTELSIFGQENTLLVSSLQKRYSQIMAPSTDEIIDRKSAFIWRNGKEVHLASAYDLFLESYFSSNPVTIIVSRPEKTIIGPIKTFKVNIALTGLLLFFVVVLFCSLSIRRSLRPLSLLVSCANAMGNGDFSRNAALEGSPEFQKLALAFNNMAKQIKSQFDDLRESEARFRASFQEASAGMALVNKQGRLLRVNKSISEMLGYSEVELVSGCLDDFICLDKSEQQEANQVEPLFDFKIKNKAVEKRLLHREGQIVSGLISTAPLDEGSKGDGLYIIHVQDITAAKAAQIENQKLEAQLHHAQKLEAIGTLAAGIAHDFNNILSAIMGYAEIARMDVQSETAIYKDLENILQACHRAADLTKQILSFSRTDGTEFVPIQLNSVVKEVIKLIRSSIPPQISIVPDISTKPFTVNADPTKIHQLIMNLCTNAYHAMMEKDSGTIKVSLTQDLSRLSEKPDDKIYVKLQVADTGSGMPPEVMKRIFEPYFTTKPKGRGTGLGLSIVHSIVEKHGGQIQVESVMGRGTTFTIHLPTIEQHVRNIRQAPQKLQSGNESILIVDDEVDITKTWLQMLSRQGYEVVSKGHPYEALEEFKKAPERYALVITDLAMPDMMGDRLCQEIFKVNPQVPIILCTGYFENMRPEVMCPAIKQKLLKPVELWKLAETVRKVIDDSNAALSTT
jgi:PAS domain S-box-containing protein